VMMRVMGGATFRVGDEAVLLVRKSASAHRLLGLAAGKLDVERARDGRALVRWPAGDGVEIIALDDAMERLRRSAP
jgi:hypothetical protein